MGLGRGVYNNDERKRDGGEVSGEEMSAMEGVQRIRECLEDEWIG